MNNITTPRPKASKKFIALAAAGPVLALVFGIAIGAAASGVEPSTTSEARPMPAPAETVEVEVPVEVEADRTALEACQRAVAEWSSISLAQNEQVAMPYNDVVLILHGQMTVMLNEGVYAMDISEIERASSMIEQTTRDLESLTARVDALQPDMQTCSAG